MYTMKTMDARPTTTSVAIPALGPVYKPFILVFCDAMLGVDDVGTVGLLLLDVIKASELGSLEIVDGLPALEQKVTRCSIVTSWSAASQTPATQHAISPRELWGLHMHATSVARLLQPPMKLPLVYWITHAA